jgi:hypothetical protein
MKGMVRKGKAWHVKEENERHHMTWNGIRRHGIARHGIARHHIAWQGKERNGMTRQGKVR